MENLETLVSMMHPHNGILVSSKEEQSTDTHKSLDRARMTTGKKPGSQGYTLNYSICMTVWKG